MELHVQNKWILPPEIGCLPVPPSGIYDVVLDENSSVFVKNISQAIEPNTGDRFTLTLSANVCQYYVFLFKVDMYYDEDNKHITSSNILYSFVDNKKYVDLYLNDNKSINPSFWTV